MVPTALALAESRRPVPRPAIEELVGGGDEGGLRQDTVDRDVLVHLPRQQAACAAGEQ
jgi:hypothetical protein